MKVLITGGLGFIGSNIAKKFISDKKNVVTIIDNLDINCGGNLYNIESFKDDLELVNADICDKKLAQEIIKDKDLIINCAAISSHSLSMEEPKRNINVNVEGVLNILETMRSLNRDIQLIQIGTTTQTGILDNQDYIDEQSIQNPLDVYSASKVFAEQLTKIYSTSYGLNISNIRLPNVFGPRAEINSSKLTFNNYFIGQALQKKPINVYSPGDQIRNIIFIDDAVDAVYLLSKFENKKNETFLAVSDNHHSVLEIAKITAKLFNGSVSLVDWPKTNTQDVGSVKFSNKKIKSVLSWEPKYNLKDGLEITKEYYSKNLEKYL